MLDIFYLPSCLILLRTLQGRGYYVHFLIKIVEVQGNLSNLPSVTGVIGSPRILIYISLTSLCLTYSPVLTHLFGRNEKFVLINFFYNDIKSSSPA